MAADSASHSPAALFLSSENQSTEGNYEAKNKNTCKVFGPASTNLKTNVCSIEPYVLTPLLPEKNELFPQLQQQEHSHISDSNIPEPENSNAQIIIQPESPSVTASASSNINSSMIPNRNSENSESEEDSNASDSYAANDEGTNIVKSGTELTNHSSDGNVKVEIIETDCRETLIGNG